MLDQYVILKIESVSVEGIKPNKFIKFKGEVRARFQVFVDDRICLDTYLISESRATDLQVAQRNAIQEFVNGNFYSNDFVVAHIKSFKIDVIEVDIIDLHFRELFQKLLGLQKWNDIKLGDPKEEDHHTHFGHSCPFH